MAELTILVFFVAIYAIVRLVSTVASWTGTWHRPYSQLAVAFDGRVESRGNDRSPLVSFEYKGSLVRVGLAPEQPGQIESIPRSRVVARFAEGVPFRLELAPYSRIGQAQPPKGTRRVEVDEPHFNRAYVVHANDQEIARDFLTPVVQLAVNRMHELAHQGGMLISVSPERMLVQVDRDLGVEVDLLAWAVRDSLLLHDALIEAVEKRLKQGVAIIEGSPDDPPALDPVVCKVCGDAITEGVVMVCETCKTPHHRDCWNYVGGCSIYGCQGKKGRAAPAATP